MGGADAAEEQLAGDASGLAFGSGCNPSELGALGGFLHLSELPSGGITVPGARLGLGGSVGPIPSSLF